MKTLVTLSFLICLISCNVEPEPIAFGKDACHSCKMTLIDRKFGAELVTKKGKIYKFDDLNCLQKFYNSDEVSTDEFQYKLVVDFSQPEKLIDAQNAFYLKSSEIKTPMNSEVAAFESKQNMEEVNKKVNGVYLVWGELVTQFK